MRTKNKKIIEKAKLQLKTNSKIKSIINSFLKSVLPEYPFKIENYYIRSINEILISKFLEVFEEITINSYDYKNFVLNKSKLNINLLVDILAQPSLAILLPYKKIKIKDLEKAKKMEEFLDNYLIFAHYYNFELASLTILLNEPDTNNTFLKWKLIIENAEKKETKFEIFTLVFEKVKNIPEKVNEEFLKNYFEKLKNGSEI